MFVISLDTGCGVGLNPAGCAQDGPCLSGGAAASTFTPMGCGLLGTIFFSKEARRVKFKGASGHMLRPEEVESQAGVGWPPSLSHDHAQAPRDP